MGKTNPLQAAPGTIRGDLGLETGRNLVHGSDSPESAAREIGLFFPDGGILSYDRDVDRWIFE
jgi:nucleoside-diphosphate kinase